MFGFRKHLSTQDVFLLLKEDLIAYLSTKSKSSILATDIKRAFNNVRHETILSNFEDLGCGFRMYNYAKHFLMDRMATLRIYNLRSDIFRLPSKETPHGSVISPVFLSVAMIKLPSLFDAILELRHTFIKCGAV